MLIIETPFERVAMDLIGVFRPKTDYTTSYPEAAALRDIVYRSVKHECLGFSPFKSLYDQIDGDLGRIVHKRKCARRM
jgi:hypothetical protein